MEPNVREIVRDWRLAIVSEGMYMDPSIITEALETGEGVEEVAEAIALETKREIADYSEYKTTGSLPVAECLRVIMEQEFEPVEELDAVGTASFAIGYNAGAQTAEWILSKADTMKNRNKEMDDKHKNAISTDQSIRNGNFKKIKNDYLKWLNDCKYGCDALNLIGHKRRIAKELNAIKAESKKNPSGCKFKEEEFEEFKRWLNKDFDKLLREKCLELSKKQPLPEKKGAHTVSHEEALYDGNYSPVTEKKSDFQKTINRGIGLIKYGAQHDVKMLTDSKYRKKNVSQVRLGVGNGIRCGGNVFATGKFEKVKTGLTKTVKSCKSKDDIDYLRSDTKTFQEEYEKVRKSIIKDGILPITYGKNKKPNYTIDELDAYAKWVKTEYPKMINERSKELKAQMESVSTNEENSLYEQSSGDSTEALRIMIESLLGTVRECGFNPNQRNLNEITPMDGTAPFCVTPWSTAEKTVGTALCDICDAETDEELTEAMIHFARVVEAVNHEYSNIALESDDFEDEDVEESVGTVVRGAARNVRKTTRKVVRKMDSAVKSAKVTAKKTIDPVVMLIDKNMQKFKEADIEERREIVLKGGLLPKIMRWLKRSIGLVLGVAVGAEVPIVALITAITFIGMICTDKYLDRKQRNMVLRQLEDEMEIINEKIDDSRGDMNKQKKYELMRIRNKLKRTSDKIRYNLKVNDEDDIVQNIKTGKANVK